MSEKVVSINEEQPPVFQVVLLYKQAVPVKNFYYTDFLCSVTPFGKEVKYSKDSGLEIHTARVSGVKGLSTFIFKRVETSKATFY